MCRTNPRTNADSESTTDAQSCNIGFFCTFSPALSIFDSMYFERSPGSCKVYAVYLVLNPEQNESNLNVPVAGKIKTFLFKTMEGRIP